MKIANKKAFILIACLLLSLVLIFSVLCIFVFDNGLSVAKNKKMYQKTGDVKYLYDLCSDLLLTSRYGDVIEYYPKLFEESSFDKLIIADSENNTYFDNGFGSDDVKSVYTVVYFNAYLEKFGEEYFQKEFDKYSYLLSFNINDNEEVLMFSTILLNSYRFPDLKIDWFKVKKTETLLACLEKYVTNATITNEQKEITSVFIRKMRFLINTYDKDRINELVLQYNNCGLQLDYLDESRDNFHELPYGFVLVEDDLQGGYFFGNKSWRNSVVIYVEGNITTCEYNDDYICLEQTCEDGAKKYYIIDSLSNEIYGEYLFEEYNLKVQEFAISDLKPIFSDNQGTVRNH